MLQLTGENEKNCEVSERIRRSGPWKEISFGDYICHTFQGDCWADRSPLHEAAAQGRLLALKTLIAQGVNVNLVTINRVSSLHEACLGGHVACAKALLENGAHVNGVTVHGATPLFNACCSGSAACVNVLLEFGAKAQLEVHLASPIHEAVKRGHRECMEILLANNVNIDHEVPQLGTPLYVACTYQRVDCVKKLLELGASVDHGQWLDTPLHAAARQSNVEVIHLLTDYGANLKRRNAQGKSALDLAAPKSSVEQALLLREGPPALSQLCRLCVRKCLGRACHQAIHKLHLPEPLERFLLYQ
ncbi:ankyrin repeat and SOCS box containing 11 [Homo sapiens]|uniref:Isoform 3 of Ankyrin repeat and SOCS box protein 11 n=1 Tax=Homo sapiens TaxID=9606 RepID=Q8WXH4-3|nr:ankyrin repeat and SOCS box protein 11 isoform b [Homo sapiens]KAI2598722.1 ankyrin repeat and SOCS box containing 11 [Homo sapiens]KAI3998937.1 ankyrin repeat and SOCS box containing 11 [Homo sapiens]|eukprot:NP_001012428.1 ankyrin repeat and SOCS box protein 11 isoform b [Homo sapiens]